MRTRRLGHSSETVSVIARAALPAGCEGSCAGSEQQQGGGLWHRDWRRRARLPLAARRRGDQRVGLPDQYEPPGGGKGFSGEPLVPPVSARLTTRVRGSSSEGGATWTVEPCVDGGCSSVRRPPTPDRLRPGPHRASQIHPNRNPEACPRWTPRTRPSSTAYGSMLLRSLPMSALDPDARRLVAPPPPPMPPPPAPLPLRLGEHTPAPAPAPADVEVGAKRPETIVGAARRAG